MLRSRIEIFILICMAFACLFLLSGCSTFEVSEQQTLRILSEPQKVSKINPNTINPVGLFYIQPKPLNRLPELQIAHTDPKEVTCVANVMYHEARGEGRRGMIAVGQVVVNRTLDPRFPNTACGVVHEGKYVRGKPVRGQCQFSWVCDGKPEKIRDKDKYAEAQELARLVLSNQAKNIVGKSLFFHATYVKPNWKKYRVTYRVGRHIFYA